LPPHIVGVIKIKENELGEAWRRQKMNTGFWLGNLNEGDHCEDAGVDERKILEWILKVWV
jgi:hypothetical protein